MALLIEPPNGPVIRVYDGQEYEILPVSNFESSPMCGTTSELLAAAINPEDEDHECRVLQAQHARSKVKNPFNISTWTAARKLKKTA